MKNKQEEDEEEEEEKQDRDSILGLLINRLLHLDSFQLSRNISKVLHYSPWNSPSWLGQAFTTQFEDLILENNLSKHVFWRLTVPWDKCIEKVANSMEWYSGHTKLQV